MVRYMYEIKQTRERLKVTKHKSTIIDAEQSYQTRYILAPSPIPYKCWCRNTHKMSKIRNRWSWNATKRSSKRKKHLRENDPHTQIMNKNTYQKWSKVEEANGFEEKASVVKKKKSSDLNEMDKLKAIEDIYRESEEK